MDNEKVMKLWGFQFKITSFRIVLMAISLLFIAVVVFRLFTGLGSTNLTDQWPWGLWILMDVYLGVALAAGGFVVCGLYYIFGQKWLKPVVKAAILTAWLGYMMVAFGLLMDLGRWYNFWRPLVFWGHHSVMFELFWCVLCYTIVLTCEFAPTIFKRFGWIKLFNAFTFLTTPFVIMGIALSTMHQSSLGSLYILMIGKLDPIWWSLFLPIFFFLTAVAVGPAMVTLESYLASRGYKHEFEMDVTKRLGKFSLWVLGLYLIIKVIDLIYRGQLSRIFSGTFEANMFLLEIIIGVILPIGIYLLPEARKTSRGIVTASILVIIGVILNRVNLVFTGMIREVGAGYFPSFTEITVTFGLISCGVLAYMFFAENFGVFSGHDHEHHQEVFLGSTGKRTESFARIQS